MQMRLDEFLKFERGMPLDVAGVKRLVKRPNLRFIFYDDIGRKTLEALLPKKECGMLILFRDTSGKNQGIGHFVLLFKHPTSGTHYFDHLGLGMRRDAELTGNDPDVIKRLIAGKGVVSNKHAFQKLAHDVQSCGRHVACRYNMAHFDEGAYRKFLSYKGIASDDLVTLLTLSNDLAHWEHVAHVARASGGSIDAFMSALGKTVVDPNKWALTAAIRNPRRYWENQIWGVEHAPRSLAYAAGTGISATSNIIQRGNRAISAHMTGKLFDAMQTVGIDVGKDARASGMHLLGDMNIAARIMQPAGDALRNFGEADQKKFWKHSADDYGQGDSMYGVRLPDN